MTEEQGRVKGTVGSLGSLGSLRFVNAWASKLQKLADTAALNTDDKKQFQAVTNTERMRLHDLHFTEERVELLRKACPTLGFKFETNVLLFWKNASEFSAASA
jgi:hypothetical protein